MAKSLSADQLESIMTTVLSKTLPDVLLKVLDKFEACLDKLVDKFEARLDRVYSDLHNANVRIDKMEVKISELEKSIDAQPVSATTTALRQGQSGNVDSSVQVLMAVEAEKLERSRRQCNVIITGLPQVQGVSDEEVFTKLCEENLTTKPQPLGCQRIGRPNLGSTRRLKVTLDSETAVLDLISSSYLLHESQNEALKKVFINRDLTPMEAQMAYDVRQLKRSTGTTRAATTSAHV